MKPTKMAIRWDRIGTVAFCCIVTGLIAWLSIRFIPDSWILSQYASGWTEVGKVLLGVITISGAAMVLCIMVSVLKEFSWFTEPK